ncbi:MAG: anthranilate phosphoribosyltransferase, partial [Promethearchaeota archaeon]
MVESIETFGIKDAINKKAVKALDLSEMEAYLAMKEVMSGEATPAQIGAFLVSFLAEKTTSLELKGFVKCMKEFANKISPQVSGVVIDTCGTGGDRLKTINISTLTALIVAGAGVPVAKHGNRSVTSVCGSADVLESFGVNILAEPGVVQECIERVGIGFMFAPRFHPAMKHAIGPRREIGVRTVFNMIGPLTNPADAKGQVLGIYDKNCSMLMADTLISVGVNRFFIVNNEHGADELLPVGKNHVVEGKNGKIIEHEMTSRDFGVPEVKISDLICGKDKSKLIEIFGKLLRDEGSRPLKNAVLMNSALAIITGSKSDDFKDAFEIARNSLESGAAAEKLKELVLASGGDLDKY